MKKKFYTESAYVLGLVFLALGTALIARGDFGMSVVVAPAYIIYLKVSESLPFFTFGMSSYLFQGVLLLLAALIRKKWKRSYLLTFCSVVLYGFLLDGITLAVALLPAGELWQRILWYFGGQIIACGGISLLFHTYLPMQGYELFVKELADTFGWNLYRCKTGYDCVNGLIAVGLSFAFFGFGQLRGIHWGTLLTAGINGWMISRWTKHFQRFYDFTDRFPGRKFFQS